MGAGCNPPKGGSVGVYGTSPIRSYADLVSPTDRPRQLLTSQFCKSGNHHRGDIPDRFYMKIEGSDEILYKHAFSQHVNVKARNQSKKQRETNFFVFDGERIEERIAMGRPAAIGKYRNGEYIVI